MWFRVIKKKRGPTVEAAAAVGTFEPLYLGPAWILTSCF